MKIKFLLIATWISFVLAMMFFSLIFPQYIPMNLIPSNDLTRWYMALFGLILVTVGFSLYMFKKSMTSDDSNGPPYIVLGILLMVVVIVLLVVLLFVF